MYDLNGTSPPTFLTRAVFRSLVSYYYCYDYDLRQDEDDDADGRSLYQCHLANVFTL